MAREDYGYRGGDVVTAKVTDPDATGGFVYAPTTATFDVFTTRTGSTQITDLQSPAGATITQVTPTADGRILFKGPDAFTAELWLQDTASPGSPRWLCEPTSMATRAGTGGGGVTAHSALTGLTTGDDHTQYLNTARGNALYVPLASQATTSAKGLVELATAAEQTTGTDPTRVPTVDIVRTEIDNHSHVSTDITDVNFADYAEVTKTPLVIRYTTTPPNRSTVSSDPTQPVWWQGLNPPSKSGTGSTGAQDNDMYSKTAS